MKKQLSYLMVILLGFLFTYQLITNIVIKRNNLYLQNSNNVTKTNSNKSVSYSDGEYQKERNKWEKKLQILYEKIINNMLIPFEQIVIQNYLYYETAFNEIFEEMTKIVPSLRLMKIHQNLILEAKTGSLFCNSYMNDLKKFDTNFKKYFLIHQQNIVINEKNKTP